MFLLHASDKGPLDPDSHLENNPCSQSAEIRGKILGAELSRYNQYHHTYCVLVSPRLSHAERERVTLPLGPHLSPLPERRKVGSPRDLSLISHKHSTTLHQG